MTLLPIPVTTTTPTSGAAAGEAATTNGDFAALLALVSGTAPAPNDPALPEIAALGVAPPEPQPEPVEPQSDLGESRCDLATAPDAAAVVAMPMPMPAAAHHPGLPVPIPPRPAEVSPRPAESPIKRVPASPVAVEASRTLVEVAPVAGEVSQAVVEAPGRPAFETGSGEARVPAERPPADVLPPLRSGRPVEVSVPPVAAHASPALEEISPPPVPTTPGAPSPPGAETLVEPPRGAATRDERPAVRVPASPVAVEVSPALVATPPLGEESPVVPENLLPERRVVEKPLPRVDVPASASLPAAAVRTEGTLPADGPAPTPVAPPAVPEQIVSVVVPLHGRGDGRHEVTLELRPEDLGTIRVEVSVEQQTVHLTLHAAEPATGRLLSAALAELRTALADAGLRAGDLAVSPDGGSPDGGRAAGRGSRPEPPPSEMARGDATPEKPRVLRSSAAGRLDLLL